MPDTTNTLPPRRQGTVQLCTFAIGLNRKAARAIKENNKIMASAAVMAFSRLPPDDQIRLCAEARQQHVTAAPATAPGCLPAQGS
ncbi:MAG: hypothetical protein JWO38_4449 [Gemmataceae bacterium]|nr:hypothetical protein [Gemmataceae bacterium]